ncbi:uncharacterized protein LOC105280152 isoform X2 [Ooceraea biroi]|uniref:uncharacterized protein LOC105280152 isoform X2 n=1 Tax=Ooceraea biroi TaxID=2015173 RepID=UPI000F09053D|nr:uncharacterized protein LOC105280152 isoform X2 [Ooceraea biroi]
MISIAQHFRLHRNVLFVIGLWPYNQSKFVKLQLILFLFVQTSFIVFQLTSLITAECTIDLVIKILSTIFYFLFCVTHYISFWINAYTVRGFVERLQHICNKLKDKNEIAIMKRYGSIAENVTFFIMLFAVCCVFMLSLLPILPWILGTFLFANESQPLYDIQIVTEYFVDKEKTFYLTLLHTYASLYIGVTAMVGGGMMLIAYLIHICGLFSIASYRMEQSLILNINEKPNLRNKKEIDKKIGHAVDVHRTAIELSEFFISNFHGTFFCIIAMMVLCLSLNLYQISQSALHQNIDECLFHLIFAIDMLIYSFIANYSGQEVIEHYNDIFSVAVRR